jgi:hypothetical protein
VADKYDIWRLLQPAADHLGKALQATPTKEVLGSAIRGHYSTCSTSGSVAGKVIASTTIRFFRDLVQTDSFAALLGGFPVFAADIAVYYHEEGMFNVRRIDCQCGRKNLFNNDGGYVSNTVNLNCHYCPRKVSPGPQAW